MLSERLQNLTRTLRRGDALGLAAIGLLVAIPLAGVASYDMFRLELILLYATAAMGLALVVGFAGELLLSQPAVIAIAAYATALVDIHLGWEPILIAPVAIVVGIVVGVVTGSPGLRVSGLYLGIMSFFAVVILADVAAMTEEWSGGEAGLSGISTFRFFGMDDRWVLFEACVVVFVVAFLGLRHIVNSGYGLRLIAMRDTPEALQASGVSLTRTKFSVYAVSAVPGALMGWMFPYVNHSVGHQFFGLSFALLLLAAVELSGRGTLLGTAIAAAALQTYSLAVGPFSEYNEVGLGAVLLIAIVLFPRGLSAVIPARVQRVILGVRGRPVDVEEDPADVVAARTVTPTSDGALEVREISKSFAGLKALSEVSLTVKPGKVVGLIGGNGSGKTTLINVITGLLRADDGTVQLDGEHIAGLAPDRIAARGISRTFQLPQLIEGATIRRNVEVGLLGTTSVSALRTLVRPASTKRLDRLRERRADEAIGLIHDGGADFADEDVDVLPLGMKRVVEVARVVASGARYVLLDEPASGLSDEELERLGGILTELRARGHGVLFVEHNVGFLMKHCDEVVLLHEGQVQATYDVHSGDELPEPLRDYFAHVPSLREHAQAPAPEVVS